MRRTSFHFQPPFVNALVHHKEAYLIICCRVTCKTEPRHKNKSGFIVLLYQALLQAAGAKLFAISLLHCSYYFVSNTDLMKEVAGM